MRYESMSKVVKSVIKRDGRIVDFDETRISQAIIKAVKAVGGSDFDEAVRMAGIVTKMLCDLDRESVDIDTIQDIVEKVLIEEQHAATAKAYILYRRKRDEIREMSSALMRAIEELTFGSSVDVELKRENANIDGDTAMGTMLRFGSETSKRFSLSALIGTDIAQAHKNGDIHIHDLEFFPLTETCCQIDLEKLFTGGFSTGHGYLREPSEIRSYGALACIAIQGNQNEMHGGQSIPAFDHYMAPGVAKSFVKNIYNVLRIRYPEESAALNQEDIDDGVLNNEGIKETLKAFRKEHRLVYDRIDDIKDVLRNRYTKILTKDEVDLVIDLAKQLTEIDTHQAMEAVIHNLNSMHSRAGAQVPFSSINFGTDTSEEGRLVIKEILKATEEGLGNGETAIFPISIFKVKEGVNYNPGDPNYDLFKFSMKVSAKRLFPNYTFLDAPYNLKYYKEGHPETEVATMGCTSGQEVIRYKIDDTLYTECFVDAYFRVKDYVGVEHTLGAKARTHAQELLPNYIDTSKHNITIYDDKQRDYVKVKKFIKNNVVPNKRTLVLSDGRTLSLTGDHPLFEPKRGRVQVDDLNEGDMLVASHCSESVEANLGLIGEHSSFERMAYIIGVSSLRGISASNTKIGIASMNSEVTHNILAGLSYQKAVSQIRLEQSGDTDTIIASGLSEADARMFSFANRGHVPVEVFSASMTAKQKYLAGVIDAVSYSSSWNENKTSFTVKTGVLKRLANTLVYLANDLHIKAKQSTDIKTTGANDTKLVPATFRVILDITPSDIEALRRGEFDVYKREAIKPQIVTIVKKLDGWLDMDDINHSYDVETETDMFTVSGIISHNCRTRVIGNVYDPTREIVTGRGNLSFTSINLPRLAIEANNKIKGARNIKKFYELLDDKLELVHKQLLERFKTQCRKHPRNYPFLMGQGIWIDSDKLWLDDSIEEILKHGTLSVGFIGLAETLTMLIGAHHGESEEAQQLGLEIIGHMREATDRWSQEEKRNYSLIGTPAEGLSGRFIQMDKKLYGEIPGVTDRQYYTNSSHVPVYYDISAMDKISTEAPYHELENGGHICYIELDGDISNNIEAFETVLRFMHDAGVGYGAINHPVDRDPVCGYVGLINDVCPRCGRHDGEAMTIEMWNSIKHKVSDKNMANTGYHGDEFEEHDRQYKYNPVHISSDM